MRPSLFLLPLLLCGGACHHAKPTGATAPTAKGATAAPSAVVVRFERTPCMGKCPSFVAEFDAEGTLRYHGGKFAPKEGDTTVHVAAETIRNVQEMGASMRFHLMPADEYGRGMMDAPSAIVTLNGHTVTCVGGECPPELRRLHQYLDREIRTALGLEAEQ